MVHAPVDMKVVVGIDEAILKKAEELIPISPDEPRCLRSGTMYFAYEGYFVISHNDGRMLWQVESIAGTPLPKELEGSFTFRELAMKAIDRHGDEKQKEEGKTIQENEVIKLKQDIERGAKVDAPFEWQKLPIRSYENSQRRKRQNDKAAADKATVMEGLYEGKVIG